MSLGDLANLAANQAGSADYLNSLFGSLNAGDASKSADQLQHLLDVLGQQDQSTLQKIKSQFEKFQGKESRFDRKTGQLMKELAQGSNASKLAPDNNAIGQAAGGLHAKLAGGNSDAILETAFLILQSALAQGNQDAQTIMQKVKELNDQKKKRTTRLLLGSGGVIALLLLVGVAVRLFNPAGYNPGPPDANPGPPESNPGPPDINPGPPEAACSIKFVNPSAQSAIPESGPVLFEWTNFPGAAGYSFELDPPAGGGSPLILPLGGTSKTIYMENLPAGGDYRMSVSALSASQAVLCRAQGTFTKTASSSLGKKDRSEGGSSSSGRPCISVAACP